jgi:hypothetical protein
MSAAVGSATGGTRFEPGRTRECRRAVEQGLRALGVASAEAAEIAAEAAASEAPGPG